MSMTTRFGAAEHIDPIGPAAKRTTVIGIMYLAPPLPGVGPIFFGTLSSPKQASREKGKSFSRCAVKELRKPSAMNSAALRRVPSRLPETINTSCPKHGEQNDRRTCTHREVA